MKEEKISIYRVLPIIGMFLSLIVSTGILFIVNKKELGEFLCVLLLILGFIPILIFELGYERRRGKIGNNTQTTYKRLSIGFSIASALMVLCSFFPEYFRPVMLMGLALIAFSNQFLGIIASLFLNIILSVASVGNIYEFLSCMILIMIGGLLADALQFEEYRLYVSLIYMSCSIFVPNIFYFLANEEIHMQNIMFGLLSGIIISIISIVLYPKLKEDTQQEILHSYVHYLEDDYIQVRAVRAYSWNEYRHARKVSDLAYKYAKTLGFHAELAAAAGMFYRMDRWEGTHSVEKLVSKANELCFPDELVLILSEYYGEEKLPSTPESALVHMLDALLIKLELLDKEVGTSKWNREVLISQTLNEFSSSGLYDKSGLSINAFLKIREWLAKEELL